MFPASRSAARADTQKRGGTVSGEPPVQPGATGPRDPRAEAAAAKAYAKAQRPWYKKKRWIILLGLIAVIAIASAGSSSSDNSSSTSSQTSTPPAQTDTQQSSAGNTQTQSSSGPTANLPITDGD